MIALLAAGLALAFPALVIVAAIKDVTGFTIPNWISLALVAVFPMAALAAGLPLAGVALHAGVGAAALVLGMILFALRWLGGGDAKLLAAAALWLGWPAVSTLVLVTAIAGGALSLGLVMLRSAQFRPFVLMGPPWFVRLAEPREGVPYGLAICLGALAALPRSPFMAALPAL